MVAQMNRRLDGMPWVGLLCVLFSAILAARLIWEQTALSVQRGPQMVGFSLIHSGIGALLFLGPLAGIAWAVATAVAAVRRKSWPDPLRLGLLGAFSLSVLLM